MELIYKATKSPTKSLVDPMKVTQDTELSHSSLFSIHEKYHSEDEGSYLMMNRNQPSSIFAPLEN